MRDALSGETLRRARRQRRQRHRRVGRPPAPRGAARRGRGAAHPPLARHAHHARHETLPLAAGAIVPAGGGRAIFALPWLGSTLVGTTDNDYDADDLDHVRPAEDDIDYLLDAVNAYFGAELGRERHHRRLRRRAAADLDRRPEEVGRHLAQGRALRDLERDDHDHRRQADDVAADGEDGRRPPGRARGARRAPCRTHEIPLGQADRRRASCRGSRACPRRPTSASPAATATRPTRCSRWPRESGELAQPIVPGGPADLLAEAVYAARREQARERGRRAAAPHAPRRCWRRAASADPEGATARARGGGDGGRAGLGRRAARRPRAAAFLDEAARRRHRRPRP